MRVGLGYDVHKLVEGRKLIIGGVNVPHEKGLLGHSDADVLIHAVMDSILGALALGDIGKHFPDTDEKYKGADSMKLLEFVYNLINEKGYGIGNIDCTIIAQSPKMAPHIQNMRENIAKALNTSIENINVKATTEEGETTYVFGIGKDSTKERGFVVSLKYAVNKTGSLFKIMIETVKSLFTGGVSVNDLSGPVGIYNIVGTQAKNGVESLLYLLAYLSINVGVINLIPFPAFDGGHILFLIIEKIIGKPVPEKVESTITGIGFILLMILMIYITGHDILNLFH